MKKLFSLFALIMLLCGCSETKAIQSSDVTTSVSGVQAETTVLVSAAESAMDEDDTPASGGVVYIVNGVEYNRAYKGRSVWTESENGYIALEGEPEITMDELLSCEKIDGEVTWGSYNGFGEFHMGSNEGEICAAYVYSDTEILFVKILDEERVRGMFPLSEIEIGEKTYFIEFGIREPY